MDNIIEESFEKEASEQGAKSLFQLASRLIGNFGKRKIDAVKISKASENYLHNFLERHGTIKILGMPEPVSLVGVYTSVKVVYADHLIKEKAIETLEANFRNNRGDFSISNNRLRGIEIANNKRLLNVLGAPGSGKSTFLKKIGIESLIRNSEHHSHETYVHDCVPVLVELRRFKNEEIDLLKTIKTEFEIAGFPESSHFVDEALKAGNLLILLDGLDEVPNRLIDDVITHIKDFTDRYSKNRYITSCRTAFYKTYLKNFTDIEIASFDNDQIKQFIRNWFKQEKDKDAGTAESFIKLLFEPANSPTHELARTPLLLTFLCLTFDSSLRFPANRSNLYKRALDILMERWAAEKRIHQEDIYQEFNSVIETEMLSEISAEFLLEDKIFFYSDELKTKIREFFEKSESTKSINPAKVLDAVEVQQGLVVQRAPEIYSFSHLTIQEYLTANYFFSSLKVGELIEDKFLDPRWREVFLLLTGLGQADRILLLMTDFLKQHLKKDELLLSSATWISTVIAPTEDFEKDAYKRVFLLSLLLSFKRYYHGMYVRKEPLVLSASTLLGALNVSFEKSFRIKDHINGKDANTLLDLLSTWQQNPPDYSIYKKRISEVTPVRPMSKMLEGSRHAYRKKILEHFYEALKVPDNIGFLRLPKYEKVSAYLEAYKLLIDCKHSSLRVSKDTWKTICLTLLSI